MFGSRQQAALHASPGQVPGVRAQSGPARTHVSDFGAPGTTAAWQVPRHVAPCQGPSEESPGASKLARLRWPTSEVELQRQLQGERRSRGGSDERPVVRLCHSLAGPRSGANGPEPSNYRSSRQPRKGLRRRRRPKHRRRKEVLSSSDRGPEVAA